MKPGVAAVAVQGGLGRRVQNLTFVSARYLTRFRYREI
jgi:hypothetical protein